MVKRFDFVNGHFEICLLIEEYLSVAGVIDFEFQYSWRLILLLSLLSLLSISFSVVLLNNSEFISQIVNLVFELLFIGAREPLNNLEDEVEHESGNGSDVEQRG